MIKLAMIVRDEAPSIERTLLSALPAVDRWCILDTGSTDGTQDIIRRVMAPRHGRLVEESGFEYADTGCFDYAAARNRLLQLADTDCAWLLMLDGDDVLEFDRPPKADELGPDAFSCLYGTAAMTYSGGKTTFRPAKPPEVPGFRIRIQDPPELASYCFDSFRLIRTAAVSAGLHYEMPIHEILVPVETVPPRVRGVAITHYPGPPERLAASFARQVKVLSHFLAGFTPEQEASRPWLRPRTTYYLAQSHWSLEHWTEALDLYLARAAMGGAEEEVYESLRRAGICAQHAGRPWPECAQMFLAAHTARPQRGEAMLELAKHYWSENNMALAHLYSPPVSGDVDDDMGTVDRGVAGKLAAIHDASAHFLGVPHYGKSAGLPTPATRRRLKFSLIHATRGRAADAVGIWQRWRSAASGLHDYEYIVSIDDNDAESQAAPWPSGAIVCSGPDGGGSVAAYNRGCWVSTGDVVVQLQDDIEPPRYWDAEFAARIVDPAVPQLLRVSDGTELHRGREVPPLTVLIGTAAYFRRCGYMYHPSYIHCYGDDDHAWKGKQEGIITDAQELVFEHRWQGPEHDATARRNYGEESTGAGAQAFEARRGAGFPDCPQLWPAAFNVVDESGASLAEGVSRDEALQVANAPAASVNP